ncbi:MAG: CoA pyrophosphatase [Rhodobacteraceae bacterium]|nr:CoA pyrophosphatase [Paracoccaceae bacterium]
MAADAEFAALRRALTGRVTTASYFDLNPGMPGPPDNEYSDAAVLVPLIVRSDGIKCILTKRSRNLAHHAGQIAFPGGRVSAVDAGPLAAAYREAYEEIGLPVSRIEILGNLPRHRTATGFRIFPFVAAVSDFEPVLQIEEVESIFEVPFGFLTDPGNFRIESAIWNGSRRRYYAIPFGPHFIWGATAAILYGLAQLRR